ncbi:hypothetical protein, partial [Acinetobacter baumannii]|uniref:hypothetical protein n=1 Tax=Acinetobacter baumannii TaxID=470 RepID=UPI0020904C70
MKKIKLISILGIVAFMLSGCLQMFPPTVAEINPGIYQLHAQSNAFGSRDALRSKLITKAEEVCKNKGFDELDSNNKIVNHGEFKHEVRQFEKSYDNQQAEQI